MRRALCALVALVVAGCGGPDPAAPLPCGDGPQFDEHECGVCLEEEAKPCGTLSSSGLARDTAEACREACGDCWNSDPDAEPTCLALWDDSDAYCSTFFEGECKRLFDQLEFCMSRAMDRCGEAE